MPRPSGRPNRRLSFEALESRTNPATATYAAGTLTITAETGNTILVSLNSSNVPGFLVVTAGATVFDSAANPGANKPAQPVQSIVVKAGTATGYTLNFGPNVAVKNLTVGGASQATNVNVGPTTRIGGNLTFTGHPTQPGDDVVTITEDVRVGGNVSLTLTGGTNTVSLAGTVGGNVSVTALAGDDVVDMAVLGDLAVGGSFNVNLGAGSNLIDNVDGSTYVGKNFGYTGGAGDDSIVLTSSALTVGGNVTANFGAATTGNTWDSGSLVVGGNLTLIGLIGDDSVNIDGGSVIGGNVLANLGAGHNALNVSSSNAVSASSIGGNLTYVGLAGHDEVFIDNVSIGKSVSATLGAGGGLTQRVHFGTKQGIPVEVAGGVTIAGGNDVDDVRIYQTRIRGGLTVNALGGNDLVQIDDTEVNGSATFNMGDGDNTLSIETQATNGSGTNLTGFARFQSNLTYVGGSGKDTVDLSDVGGQQVLVGGNIKLTGGAGTQDRFVHDAANTYLGTKALLQFELGETF